MRAQASEPFEERSIVIPPSDREGQGPMVAPRRPAPLPLDDPAGAYLAALSSLERDKRWVRQPNETPAAHAGRIRAEGMESGAFGRLAAAYQLVRYGASPLTDRERGRIGPRLRTFRRWLDNAKEAQS